MAISVSTGTTKGRSNDTWGARRVTKLRVTLDASYPTGGYAFTPKAQGHQGAVDTIILVPRYASGANGTLTRRFEYDYTAKTIVGIVTSTGVEVGNGVSLASVVLDVFIISD